MAGRSDRRVACEGQFGVYGEDAGAPFWGCWRFLVIFLVGGEVQESGFREVELARDRLEGFGGWVLVCWDGD